MLKHNLHRDSDAAELVSSPSLEKQAFERALAAAQEREISLSTVSGRKVDQGSVPGL